ncbi:MAG TPA: serine/threonine-protein kinase, partial [Isosphaeraceae bacterium]|nr:serine/threonine-protein kinase [Isosphaeraceae bacterium]
MSEQPSTERGALDVSIANRVDEICDRFEAEFQAGERPSIEAYLESAPESHRPALLRALLALEVDLLAGTGARPEASQYIERFPAYAPVITAIFAADAAQSGPLANEMGPLTAGGRRFRIVRPHARGGLGEVFLARDVELNREVALKRIRERNADNPVSRARFLLEAEVTGRLEHPGIVPVYGLGHTEDGRPYYAMRFIKGESLQHAIDAFHRPDGAGHNPATRTLVLRQLLGRFLDVCNAIDYAHTRGVLHRDLKPSNILVGPFGETLVVDWGLAKTVDKATIPVPSEESSLRSPEVSGSTPTQIGSALGTPQYMSPEQAAGRVDLLGPASDIYSL